MIGSLERFLSPDLKVVSIGISALRWIALAKEVSNDGVLSANDLFRLANNLLVILADNGVQYSPELDEAVRSQDVVQFKTALISLIDQIEIKV